MVLLSAPFCFSSCTPNKILIPKLPFIKNVVKCLGFIQKGGDHFYQPLRFGEKEKINEWVDGKGK